MELRYEKAIKDRQAFIEKILISKSNKKIIVAGPGTGKTYLFKKILKGKNNTLTLTFVNALVEDLSLELCGISEVKTLHSFALSIFKKNINNEARIFPKLSEVIKQDAAVLLDKNIDFDYIFHNMDDTNEHVKFYMERREYYHDYYGYSDIIYQIVKHLENTSKDIPIYEQVLVDEFQDFNMLEVFLIDKLAEKNPILIVGDDDQALYDFKCADKKHIRQRHCEPNSEYEAFWLPFCSRCTSVIIKAVNDIILMAQRQGHLKGRIAKEYKYFETENKDKESSQNPKIFYKNLFPAQISWFIQKQIEEIAKEVKAEFSVLIISPYKKQSSQIVDGLKKRFGFKNIKSAEDKIEKEPTLLDGLKILMNDDKSNLGWRIVLKQQLMNNDIDFKAVIKETNKKDSKSIYDLIGSNIKKEVKAMLKILKSIENDKEVDKADIMGILDKLNIDVLEKGKELLSEEIASNYQGSNIPGIKRIPIKATTIQSSKGLAAEYVFITHFDDMFYLDKGQVKDKNICNILVALTRAKKRVYLISTDTKKEPIFMKWIDSQCIDRRI
ncbi:MAG: hypothetical protein A2452_04315 [Candidatus Firestonebacteria bacterium RIFOXYC2_FULL_39_67]|nr:MAG: hypothetical protein A2536_11210 [Candidatus Firestonebacteria bacterium RIFOXYD2_FULL_39_29]OGF54394.1 MAG: hypothetical protein A2452_04315 [Candidatus Firestonebacteria bacterium RIFOXYC2_FULL_39_67]